MAQFTEKRQFPRYACDTGVRIALKEGSGGGFWGTLSDISFGGCYIYTFSPLATGQEVVLVIKANAIEINVSGKVVSFHPGVGMGISFTGFVQKDGEQTLKTYLNQLASMPKTDLQPGVFH